MDDDPELMRRAIRSQTNYLATVVAAIVGGIAGLLVGVYVLIPALGSGPGFWATLVAVPIGAFLGQRAVLSYWADRAPSSLIEPADARRILGEHERNEAFRTLTAYADLRDKGAITAEEFEAKKREVMDRL